MSTVPWPERAAPAVCSAICATRCALSAIWRDVARSSLIVVLISVIAVACSLAPDACWLAAACSSVDELRTWPTAEPICIDSELVMNQPIAPTAMVPSNPPHRMIDMVMAALARASSDRFFSKSRSS